MKKSHQILFIISGLAASSSFAQQRGEMLINFGIAHVSPQAELKSISSTEPIVDGALQGSSIISSSSDTLSFGVSYMMTDNVAAELAFGIPPKLRLSLNSPSGNHPNAINTTVVFPALLANYYFGEPSSAFRPFVGAGVSYIKFTKNGHNTTDPVVNGLTNESITINSAWSPVYKIGATYRINEKWLMNGAVLMMPLNIKARIAGPGIGAGPATTDLSMKLNTSVYMISLSREF